MRTSNRNSLLIVVSLLASQLHAQEEVQVGASVGYFRFVLAGDMDRDGRITLADAAAITTAIHNNTGEPIEWVVSAVDSSDVGSDSSLADSDASAGTASIHNNTGEPIEWLLVADVDGDLMVSTRDALLVTRRALGEMDAYPQIHVVVRAPDLSASADFSASSLSEELAASAEPIVVVEAAPTALRRLEAGLSLRVRSDGALERLLGGQEGEEIGGQQGEEVGGQQGEEVGGQSGSEDHGVANLVIRESECLSLLRMSVWSSPSLEFDYDAASRILELRFDAWAGDRP